MQLTPTIPEEPDLFFPELIPSIVDPPTLCGSSSGHAKTKNELHVSKTYSSYFLLQNNVYF